MDLSAFWSTQELSASLRHLPPAAHLLAAGGVIVGLVLWAAGEKILRMVFAALGAVIGAAVGFFLLPTVAPEIVLGFPSPHVGLFAGSMIGLIFALSVYRIAVAVLLAGGLSVAVTLVAAAGVQFHPLANADSLRQEYEAVAAHAHSVRGNESPDSARSALSSRAPEQPGEHSDSPPDPEQYGPADHDHIRGTLEVVGPIAEQVRIFVAARCEEFADSWTELSGRQQAIVVSAALSGALTGFVLGFLFPRRSAAAATAMSGAAVFIPALAWLWRAMDAPAAATLVSLPPTAWLIIWIVAAAAGFVIQTMGGRRT